MMGYFTSETSGKKSLSFFSNIGSDKIYKEESAQIVQQVDNVEFVLGNSSLLFAAWITSDNKIIVNVLEKVMMKWISKIEKLILISETKLKTFTLTCHPSKNGAVELRVYSFDFNSVSILYSSIIYPTRTEPITNKFIPEFKSSGALGLIKCLARYNGQDECVFTQHVESIFHAKFSMDIDGALKLEGKPNNFILTAKGDPFSIEFEENFAVVQFQDTMPNGCGRTTQFFNLSNYLNPYAFASLPCKNDSERISLTSTGYILKSDLSLLKLGRPYLNFLSMPASWSALSSNLRFKSPTGYELTMPLYKSVKERDTTNKSHGVERTAESNPWKLVAAFLLLLVAAAGGTYYWSVFKEQRSAIQKRETTQDMLEKNREDIDGLIWEEEMEKRL